MILLNDIGSNLQKFKTREQAIFCYTAFNNIFHNNTSREVKSGVLQCSILDWIFFCSILTTLQHIINASTRCLLTIQRYIHVLMDIDNSTSALQSDINHLYETAKWWGLNLNIKKCATLPFQQHLHTLDTLNYTVNGQPLPNVCTQMDLDV